MMPSLKQSATGSDKYGALDLEEATNFAKEHGAVLLDEARSKLREFQKICEDGRYTWKVFGLIAGILLVVNALLGFTSQVLSLSPLMAILNLYMLLFGLILIALEYKDKTYTIRFINIIRKESFFLTRPYGRGAFYTFCGTLLICKGGLVNLIMGLFISALGIFIFIASRRAVQALQQQKAALFDEEAVKQKFNELDTDKSGSLDAAELAKLCQSLGSPLNYNQLESAIMLLDKDGNGKVDYSEFLQWWQDTDTY
mmetsp:Transcript_6355/g.6571  ORF Transcript_6355/g.6571 Transcript_6355/m.6571 type:complete len:255 (-) Transcript_6355:46-810(-)